MQILEVLAQRKAQSSAYIFEDLGKSKLLIHLIVSTYLHAV